MPKSYPRQAATDSVPRIRHRFCFKEIPMLRKTSLLLAMATWLSIATFAQAKPAEVTLDEILAKNLKAHGGAEKVNAVKSVRMIAKLEYAPGADADFVIEIARPDKVHYGFTLQ